MAEEINEQMEQGPDFEKEARVKEIINKFFVRKKMEEGEDVNEIVESVAADLPAPLKAMVMEDYDFIFQVTKNEKILKQAVELSYKRLMAGYERSITDDQKMPNEAYALADAMEKIDDLFQDREPTVEDFKKVARVSFDVNGLKPVNDLNRDHKKGDLYLFMAVQAIKSPEVLEYCEKNGIKFDPERVTRDGGDEFGVIITSDKAFTREALNGFVKTVQDVLWDNKEAAMILDFNNPIILARQLKRESSEVVEEIRDKHAGSIAEFKKANNIPLGYKYRAAISGGAATLFDALTDAEFDPKNELKSSDKAGRMAKKIAGAAFSSSDRQVIPNKEAFKGGLRFFTAEQVKAEFIAAGKDISDIDPQAFEDEAANRRFQAEVYSRSEEEKELTRENQELSYNLAEAQKEIKKHKERGERARMLTDLADSLFGEGKIQEGRDLLKKIKEELS